MNDMVGEEGYSLNQANQAILAQIEIKQPKMLTYYR
jgi:hypothetical protein